MWKAPSDVRILPPHLFTLFTTSLLFLFLLFIIKCFGLTHFFMDRCREACWEWSLRKSSVRHQNQLPFPHGRRGGGKSARARGWWGGRAAKGFPLRHSPIPAQTLQVQSSQTRVETQLGLPSLLKHVEVTPSTYRMLSLWVNPSTSTNQKHYAEGLEVHMCVCT